MLEHEIRYEQLRKEATEEAYRYFIDEWNKHQNAYPGGRELFLKLYFEEAINVAISHDSDMERSHRNEIRSRLKDKLRDFYKPCPNASETKTMEGGVRPLPAARSLTKEEWKNLQHEARSETHSGIVAKVSKSKDFSDARRIILVCPACHKKGPHTHTMSLVGQLFGRGMDSHYVQCEACGQQTVFTKKSFDSISDKIERA